MLDLVRNSDAADPMFRSHFRLVRPSDAEFICNLRGDSALNAHLSTSAPEPEVQRAWIRAYQDRESRDEEFYFVIVCDGKDRGLIRMYDFRTINGERSFCWGSWIVPRPRPPGLATFSVISLYGLAFETLTFERNHFTVRKANSRVVAFFLRTGTRIEGEDDSSLHFRFEAGDYVAFQQRSRHQIAEHRTRSAIDGTGSRPR